MPSLVAVAVSSAPENGAWRDVGPGGWRQLHGDFVRKGFSVEHHRFTAGKDLDWGRSFHPDSLELCLNLEGQGTLGVPGSGSTIRPGAATSLGRRSVAIYGNGVTAHGGTGLPARRALGQAHHFVTVEFSRAYLYERTGRHPLAGSAWREPVRTYLETAIAFACVEPMSVGVQNLARTLVDPPVRGGAARDFWYEAKVQELMALFLLAPGESGKNDAPAADGELFCSRHKRLNRERVERARALLERDLENPPSLEMLAAEVGCGASHLSRSFSAEVGLTIPQYLREVRLERAARLLREGRANVTEAALAVGYLSLSHFSKAFWEKFGCCPGLYADPKLAATLGRRSSDSDRARG